MSRRIILTFTIACQSSDPDYEKAVAEGKVYWMDIHKMQEKTNKTPKLIMVDAYTDWCGWCKKMDKDTFSNPEVVSALNESFYSVKFDAETKETLNFKGESYDYVKGGRRGHNTLAKLLLKGRLGYPTISFLNEELEVISTFPGYKKPEQFLPILEFMSSRAFENQTFTDFQKSL